MQVPSRFLNELPQDLLDHMSKVRIDLPTFYDKCTARVLNSALCQVDETPTSSTPSVAVDASSSTRSLWKRAAAGASSAAAPATHTQQPEVGPAVSTFTVPSAPALLANTKSEPISRKRPLSPNVPPAPEAFDLYADLDPAPCSDAQQVDLRPSPHGDPAIKNDAPAGPLSTPATTVAPVFQRASKLVQADSTVLIAKSNTVVAQRMASSTSHPVPSPSKVTANAAKVVPSAVTVATNPVARVPSSAAAARCMRTWSCSSLL